MRYKSMMHVVLPGKSRALPPLGPALLIRRTPQFRILTSPFLPQSCLFWSNWLARRSDLKPDGSSLTPSCISARTLTSVLTEPQSIRNISSWSTLTPGAGVPPGSCRKHGRKSLFHAIRLFPHAFGIMFVTNWLLWRSLMMQADRPAPSGGGGGGGGGGTPGWLPISPPPPHVRQQCGHHTVLSGLSRASLNWRLFWSRLACGAERPVVPAPLSTCHASSNYPAPAREGSSGGKPSSSRLSYVSAS